ncbi:MAG: flagellar hook-basal body complex protein FliE [Gammaproteobacteria bacterium]|nr:flagellar hook-basal body complex protein FliE [Gammaproteobacteria bacterium]
MSTMGVEQVLAQMRTLAAQAKAEQAPAMDNAERVNFGDLLTKSVKAVNELQVTSTDLKTRFDQGDSSVSIIDITLASEKAKIAFTAMTEVRNKLVQAYHDVLNMPI